MLPVHGGSRTFGPLIITVANRGRFPTSLTAAPHRILPRTPAPPPPQRYNTRARRSTVTGVAAVIPRHVTSYHRRHRDHRPFRGVSHPGSHPAPAEYIARIVFRVRLLFIYFILLFLPPPLPHLCVVFRSFPPHNIYVFVLSRFPVGRRRPAAVQGRRFRIVPGHGGVRLRTTGGLRGISKRVSEPSIRFIILMFGPSVLLLFVSLCSVLKTSKSCVCQN